MCREFTTLLLALAASWSTACATARTAVDEAAEVRVLVFNIHAGKDAAGVDNLERVARFVRESAADIALLQEVDVRTQRSGGVDQPAVLSAGTGLHVAFGRTLDYQGGQYGIAILSRWPIVRDTMMPLPISPPQQRAGGSYEPRGALLAVVEHPVVGRVAVLNTHLDASAADDYRLQEIATLVRIAEESRGSGVPLVIGGDFNSRPESEVVRRAHGAGWQDAWAVCGPSAPGHTYPADAPVRRIDYLFLASRASCTEAAVVGEGISDHRGLLVTVVLGRG